jgi:SAM-dependent methyltransferase
VRTIYDEASAYALAFSYRDVAAEVDAILGWTAPFTAQPIRSVLELAAGPADHAREFTARGMSATALDIALAMTAYARALPSENPELLRVVTADMCSFAVEERFDLAVMMIDSIAHVLDQAALDDHFRCVFAHLNPGGCYVIEASHPADSLDEDTLSLPRWTQAGEGESVSVRWGEPDDVTDPTSGITAVSVTVDHQRSGQPAVVAHEVMLQHAWGRDDIEASLERVGGLTPRAWYGSFDGVELDDASAWRMIVVLQRR